jgi:hypothetical protein
MARLGVGLTPERLNGGRRRPLRRLERIVRAGSLTKGAFQPLPFSPRGHDGDLVGPTDELGGALRRRGERSIEAERQLSGQSEGLSDYLVLGVRNRADHYEDEFRSGGGGATCCRLDVEGSTSS